MKNITMIIFLFFTIFSGCHNSDKTSINEKVMRVIDCSEIDKDKPICSSINVYPFQNIPYQVIDTEESLNELIEDFNYSKTQIVPEAHHDIEEIENLIKKIQNSNIDFSKYNLLFYPQREGNICYYRENIYLPNNKEVEIKFDVMGNLCEQSVIIYFLFYQVSKEIETITMKIFRSDDVIIVNHAN